jgi:DNA mismatch repair ATPase MutS
MVPNPIPNDFSTKKGAILTGPNRGGKSTFCKAVGLSILCAQTWGFAFASKATLTPFARIETALSPADTLGRVSLFEAEIEFAKAVVEAPDRPLFVMMDEIFHSTNAHDGVEASRVFLHRLYALPNTVSLISTHYRTLAEEFSIVEQLQAETIPKDDRLEYTYKILPGVSTASSVMEILREKGLLKNHTPSTEL